eukprot:IDg17016t1
MVSLCGEEWKAKLVKVATDGTRKITVKVREAETRLAMGTLPGFYCVWCAAHQLDLVIQGIEFKLSELDEHHEIDLPICGVDTVLFFSRVCRRLSKHEEAVVKHLEAMLPACAPPPSWWVALLAVESFMQSVDICFKSMQGLSTVISEQDALLEKAFQDAAVLAEGGGPVSAAEVCARIST